MIKKQNLKEMLRMRRIAKKLALMLSLTMVVSFTLAATAIADDRQVPGTLTINPPNSLVIGVSDFDLYKVFSVKTHVADSNIRSYAYQMDPLFDGFDSSTWGNNYGKDLWQYLLDMGNYDADPALEPFEQKMSEFGRKQLASDLLAYIWANAVPSVNATPAMVGTSVRFSSLEPGYYLVIGTGDAQGATVRALHSFITIYEGQNANLDLKADAPSIDKEIFNHNNETWTNWTDVNIGDTVDFKLTSKVPEMRGYSSYVFNVYDTMDKGLTFDAGSVVVKIGNNITLTSNITNPANYDYTLNTAQAENGATHITISFHPGKFVELVRDTHQYGIVDDPIIITYSATLNENAVIGAPGNKNIVYLEYSNDPNWKGVGTPGETPPTGETPPVETFVYTFALDVYKYTGDLLNNPTALAEAEFQLRKVANEEESAIKFLVAAADDGFYVEGTNVYTVDSEGDTKLVTPDSGLLNLRGLDSGTYYLVETKAPYGYNMLIDPIEIVIVHEDTNGTYTINNSPPGNINVLNNAGPQFPDTGGIGSTIFYIVGLLVMGVAAIALITVRRTNKASAGTDA